MSRVRRVEQGFTLIELLLAMSFVSILLMAITVTVIQITNIYTKGITMRAVNQQGEALAQDIRRSIEASRPLDLGTPGEGGQNYQPMSAVGNASADPDGGRLCTGSYSYIWNLGKAYKTPVNKYANGDTLIRMVRVPDNGARYCADPSKPIDNATATEMLSNGDRDLALQSFSIKSVTTSADSGQALYYITMEIGTNDEGTLDRQTSITSIDTSCKPPADGTQLDDYCAVNKLEFTAKAGNAGGLR